VATDQPRPHPTLLSAPGARALLASSILARLPLAMCSIAILVHTQRLTASFAVAGLACSAYGVCGAVAAPCLGRFVDRRGQTRALAGAAMVSAVALVVGGLLPAGTPPAALIALAAVAGLATPPLPACVRTLLPTLVAHPSQLPRLFALESTALELTFVFGPPLALGVGSLWSTGGALVACGLVMAAGTLAFTVQPRSRAWRPEPVETRARAGALRSPAILTLIGIELATGTVFGATEVGVTAAAKHLADAAAAAPLLALWGAGSLLGGLVATRLGGGATTRRGLIGLVAALAASHGALAAGTGSLALTGAIILLAGATIAPTASSIYALIDRVAPVGAHTEAFSWLDTAGAGGAALGAAAAGALAQSSGPAAVFALGGAAGGAAVLVLLQGARHLPSRRRSGDRPAVPHPATA
jgi:predicted MFS family arabinose efflux permease